MQVVKDPSSGYAYEYTKVVRLVEGKPEMVLEHRLKNTGSKVIESDVYEHNFYMIDKQPTGPDVVVKFAFEVHNKVDFRGMAETRGKELVYLKEIEGRQSVQSRTDRLRHGCEEITISRKRTPRPAQACGRLPTGRWRGSITGPSEAPPAPKLTST